MKELQEGACVGVNTGSRPEPLLLTEQREGDCGCGHSTGDDGGAGSGSEE